MAQTGKKTHLAVGFFAGAQSSILSYAFISTRDGVVISAEPVTEQRFMYVALGYWPHIANMGRENLFAKNNVDSCFLYKDDLDNIVGYENLPFDHLWKIRFNEHPSNYDELGWSHGRYKPSQKQQEFLYQEYGLLNILTDYVYGENLYKLLRDIRDKNWITLYSTLPKD